MKSLNGIGNQVYLLFQPGELLLILCRVFKSDCPDGNLNKSKLQKMYSMILPNKSGTALVDHIFRVFDKDSNGSIDFKV